MLSDRGGAEEVEAKSVKWQAAESWKEEPAREWCNAVGSNESQSLRFCR